MESPVTGTVSPALITTLVSYSGTSESAYGSMFAMAAYEPQATVPAIASAIAPRFSTWVSFVV